MSLRSRSLLVRADANAQIGTGHILRCLALAQTWQKAGGEVFFQAADLPPALQERLLSEGMQILSSTSPPGSLTDADELCEAARRTRADWLVVDGYHFGSEYQRAIRDAGYRFLVIDDLGQAEHYYANFVLNQNGRARPESYVHREPQTQLLLGPKFVLLRRDFAARQVHERAIPAHARKLLVTFGGADAHHVTLKAVQGLELLAPSAPASTILIGAAHPSRKSIEEIVARASLPVELIADTARMAEFMAATDFAVCAPGTTCWEMACMGVPMITIAVASNQLDNGRFLNEAGLARHLGWHADTTDAQIAEALGSLAADHGARRQMSIRGRQLVDGAGAFRVWLHLHADCLTLRDTTPADCKRVWHWANAPDVRAASFSSDSIPWATHQQWFDGRLRDPDCLFWIAEDQGRAVGQVRFDRRGRVAVISVSVDAGSRGAGCGTLLIWLASRRLFSENDVELIRAFIKPTNLPSMRAFEKAGYRRAKDETVRGQPALVMILSRGDGQ